MKHTLDYYIDGILKGDRVVLGRAITIIESELKSDQEVAAAILEKIINKTGKAIRVGITGIPGVGKSTFIESFGKHLITNGKKIAVLTIDPSSTVTKGSILGDKTRMEELSKNPMAFIRSTASGNKLGGTANKTREAMLLCEAAGYDVIMIETVGVGQSEVSVKNMIDFFLLLALAGAGDELQGIKKGIIEMADAIVITKADGENAGRAQKAEEDYRQALHVARPSDSGWNPEVLRCSALTNAGIAEIWSLILQHQKQMTANGHLQANRTKQNSEWIREHFDLLVKSEIDQSAAIQREIKILEDQVTRGLLSPPAAAQKLLDVYRQFVRNNKS